MVTKAPTKEALRRDRVLLALRKQPDQTWQQLAGPLADMKEDRRVVWVWEAERDGWIRKSGGVKNGRGRPSNTYRLTPKGSKRASALAKRAA
jgi:predicted ArsR family transcriptional regulator